MLTQVSGHERLNNIEAAGQVLGLSRSSMYRLLRQGRIKAVKIGALTRIPDSELTRFMSEAPAAEFGTAKAA